jgi:hypothetical protein
MDNDSAGVDEELLWRERAARWKPNGADYGEATDVPLPPEVKHPDLPAEEAFHGIAGDLVRRIEPHTEADPAAILVQFLVAFGNAVGSGPHCYVEATRHHMNLFAVLVGDTSKARKGTALAWARRAVVAADPTWETCSLSGLASGEGLIEAVHDARFGTNKKGEQIVEDEGVVDKRLFVAEEEFARVLRVSSRPGNTLSEVLRDAWDGKRILRAASKHSPSRATGAHVSVVGHITSGELLDKITETDATNGIGNRFLWCFVKRSKLLPFGGDAPELDGITQRLAAILDDARTEHCLAFDRDAGRVWREVYPELTRARDGLLGAMLARGEAHVRRLAMLYAVLDGARSIGVPHLQAALAAWEYCERSARYVFGDDLDGTTADRILGALHCMEGPLSQTDLHNLFHRNISGTRLLNALEDLHRRGLVRGKRLPSTGGRPKTVWEATR